MNTRSTSSRRERDRLAKGVDARREPLLRGRRDQLVDDLADIMRAPVALVGGKRMEREKRRHHAHRFALAELVRELEQPQFALRVEAVSGLHFDGRAAAAHQRVEAGAALLEQLVVGGGFGLGDGRGDSAARFGDLLVARAGAAHGMLVGAVAAEDQVRVAVDQARSDPCAAERIDFLRAITGEFGAFTDANDLSVGDSDRAIVDDAKGKSHALERGDVAVDEQPVPHPSSP